MTRHFDWAACGTPSQYRQHLRLKIPVCEACRRAESRRCIDKWHANGEVDKRRQRRQDQYTEQRAEWGDPRAIEIVFARKLRAINLRLNGAA